jgi:hypothetical protein
MTFAQSFSGKGQSVYSISVGAFNYFHLKNSNIGFANAGNAYGIIGQGEYGVHDYVGVGWQVNAGWGPGTYNLFSTNRFYTSLGASVNFHFYRLIDDKVDADIFSDQLDIYFGININGGIGIRAYKNNNSSDIFGVLSAGPHLGVRWYPKAGNVGMVAEIGYGKSYASFGAVFKM